MLKNAWRCTRNGFGAQKSINRNKYSGLSDAHGQVFSFDENSTLSITASSDTTNTVVSARWDIPLDKYNTFGLGVLSAGSFRGPKPLRVQCQTCLMNCSRARSPCFVERNRIRARRRSSIGSSKTPLLESAKRRKYLFFRL